ncbi:MAG: 6-carboxytetrahydropterin synthase QueD [Candidatus Saganbacteria bacterium]|nr:6-carboxytetrahydropterin synthase QueD [Candidatus Saganbacteria bacterium]
MYELVVEKTFDAAHALRGYNGPCENLHGHTWRVQITLSSVKLNKIGIVKDFREIKEALSASISDFDHTNLNDLPIFKKENPTSENLARIIFERMKKKIKETSKVTVWESATSAASYTE